MPYEIIDYVKTGGLQNFDRYDKLNPVEISVKSVIYLDTKGTNIIL